MFSLRQEADLGDVMAEQIEHRFKIIYDDQDIAYLNRIVARLIAQMPPAQMQFHVMLVDLPAVNSFSLPGGRIYVTRKMVAFLRNEDELAGLLGHEMGHSLTHQAAISTTALFHEILRVDSVGDRKDIFDKFNRLMDNAARDPKAFQKLAALEEPHQYEADQVAIYAMAKAGYSPQAFGEFWNRSGQVQGKTGNWLSDVFGLTNPGEKRLRMIDKVLLELPPSCRRPAPASASEEFSKWQANVIAYAGINRPDILNGLIEKRSLEPALRTDITHLKFSPDGKYVLAQDDSSVFVLNRDPFKLLFRFDAPNARSAQFSPDSKGIVTDTAALRVEIWSIPNEQRLAAREIAVPGGCVQSEVSSDGKVLACMNEKFDLSLIGVDSGKTLLTKKALFEPHSRLQLLQLLIRVFEEGKYRWAHMAFSPDNRYFLAGAPNGGWISLPELPFHCTVASTSSGGAAVLRSSLLTA